MIVLNRSINVSNYQSPTSITTSHETNTTAPFITPTSSRRTHEEDIYEDLCYVTLRIGKDSSDDSSATHDVGSLLEKRDYCIRELIETEKNYIEALNMIIKHFAHPLRKVLDVKDRKIIFNHINELAHLHTGFYRDLCCASAGGISGLKISTCFFNWKDKFVIYGDYCANLPRAQSLIDGLCSKNDSVASAISRYQMEANDGKFKLRDLLSLPMQRILKYHLLLKELIKNTSESHEDYPGLQKAYEAMIDIGDYINEVKRDSETLQIISGIQENMTDLIMPENTELKDYGRLVRDGEVRMRSHEEKNMKNRYIFVFDKVLLMCKTPKNGQYSFKAALILSDFQVEESLCVSNTLRIKDKWNHSWFLTHTLGKNTYTFSVKSSDEKRKWIEAIEKALDNVNPKSCRNGLIDHAFVMSTFQKPQTCDSCDKLLRGLFYQGYKCTICDISVHKNCISSVRPCGAHNVPPRPSLPSSSPSVTSAQSGGEDDAFTIPSSDAFASKNDSGLESLNGDPCWTKDSLNHTHHAGFPTNHLHQRASSITDEAALRHQSLSLALLALDSSSFADNGCKASFPNYVNLNLQEYPWFAGTMDRSIAESVLGKLPNSTFLVRISPNQKGVFAISLNCSGTVKHMRICKSDGLFYLSKSKFFNTVVELVKWYGERTLAESFTGLNCFLGIPYKNVINVLSWPPNYESTYSGKDDHSINFHEKTPSSSSSSPQLLQQSSPPLSTFNLTSAPSNNNLLNLRKGDY